MSRDRMLRKAVPAAVLISTLAVALCWLSSRNHLVTPHPSDIGGGRALYAAKPEVGEEASVGLGEYHGEGARRELWIGGQPAEGLLLAEANSDSDADAVDSAGVLHGLHWHKKFLPLNMRDYAALITGALGLMVAAAGGIGGGGILVPIYMLILQFSAKYAVPLSNITIFGGAITNTYLNMKKRHPYTDRPLVDWDLILVMEPLTIGGALVGSFIQKVLPEVALTLLMVMLLVATADRTLRKGIKAYKKETGQLKGELVTVAAADASKEGATGTLLGNGAKGQTYGAAGSVENDSEFTPAELAPKFGEASGAAVGDEENATLVPATPETPDALYEDGLPLDDKMPSLEDLLEEERHTSFAKVGVMTVIFSILLVVNLLKGGGAFESPVGIVCGSFSFWATSVLSLVYLVLVSLRVRKYLVARWRIKTKLGYQYVEGDVEWNPLNTLRYPCICFFAGFFAGMFGVGGGIVKGPLMLEMGVHPSVAASTSAVMILFTSFTATTSFVVFGLLSADYAVPLFFLGLLATAVGQCGTDYLIKKFERPSFIILSIGSVVALSALMTGSNGLHDILYPVAGTGGAEGICSAGG